MFLFHCRSKNTFFKPTEDFEITGQVGNVCFLQGLVFFKGKWLLYYGTADSKIAVAEAVSYSYGAISLEFYDEEEEEDLTESEEYLLHLSEGDEVIDETNEDLLKERIFRKIKMKLQRDQEKKSKRKISKLKPRDTEL